jgi:hypothetical protein
MPCYYEEESGENEKNENSGNKIRLWKPLLFFTFFYYFFSCGIERIYQPMVNYNTLYTLNYIKLNLNYTSW